MNVKYTLEFILHARNSSPKVIRSSLAEFGSEITVSQCRDGEDSPDYKVTMVTEDPTLVFDLCAQLGRIRSVKVGEFC
jgi:dihydroxyacetone kinase-like predicted kinase